MTGGMRAGIGKRAGLGVQEEGREEFVHTTIRVIGQKRALLLLKWRLEEGRSQRHSRGEKPEEQRVGHLSKCAYLEVREGSTAPPWGGNRGGMEDANEKFGREVKTIRRGRKDQEGFSKMTKIGEAEVTGLQGVLEAAAEN